MKSHLIAVLYHPALLNRGCRRNGLTLTELLVTITIIAALTSLTVPAWSSLIRSRARQVASGMVMESLELARSTALTTKRDTWVVFRHQVEGNRYAFRIVSRGDGSVMPLGPWKQLPGGILFRDGEGTLMEEHPSQEILSSALNEIAPPAGHTFGSVMFQRSGRVGRPLRGGNQLILSFNSSVGPAPQPILLSRATGRSSSSE
ncbi:MAG: prepilin-type N-terminal cleavage/methylation domain-containing protein [Verrucomicrobia bacterium]|nr:prepilin-type N-terminal cleavage/methylation domain-containing protein [Verrucomicrobiota bacterium]